MSPAYGHTPEPIPVRVLRAVGPWVVLGLIGILALGYLGEYRSATRGDDGRDGSPASQESTAPAGSDSGDAGAGAEETATEPSGETPATGRFVRVLTEGLNLRAEPMTSATVIKTLTSGQRLTLLEEGSGWYRVRDEVGDEGWVAAGGRYTELVE